MSEIRVESSDTYEIVYTPDVLVATAGPCIVVATYARSSQMGILGDFPTPHESETFQLMLTTIKYLVIKVKGRNVGIKRRRASRSGELEVTLTGAALESGKGTEGYNEHMLAKRRYVEEGLARTGVKEIKRRFPETDMGIKVTLDTSNGEVGIEQFSLDEVVKEG